MHAEYQIDDSVIMLGKASEKYPPVPIVLLVYVPDVDSTCQKTSEAGCEIIEEPREREGDPDRRVTFRDFEGSIWPVATQRVCFLPVEETRYYSNKDSHFSISLIRKCI